MKNSVLQCVLVLLSASAISAFLPLGSAALMRGAIGSFASIDIGQDFLRERFFRSMAADDLISEETPPQVYDVFDRSVAIMADLAGVTIDGIPKPAPEEEIDFDKPIEELIQALQRPEIDSFNPMITKISPDLDAPRITKFLLRAKRDFSHETVLVETERLPNGSVQEVESKWNLSRLLANCISNPCHQTRAPCNALDDSGKCSHRIPVDADGTHHFSCIYHTEPLAVHLLLSAIFTQHRAQVGGMDEESQYMAFATALLHDVGKPVTYKTFEFRPKNKEDAIHFPAYSGHGEFGARMLKALYHPEMSLSLKQYIGLCELTNRHMCGYHGINEGDNLIRRSLLRSIDLWTKPLGGIKLSPFLSALSVGDNMGKFPEPEQVIDVEEFETERAEFDQEMKKEFDLIEYLEMANYNKNKMVMFVIGRSGTGKSFASRQIQKGVSERLSFSEDRIAIIQRDVVISAETVGIDERLEGEAYQLMYQIYSLNKELFRKSSRNALSIRLEMREAKIAFNDWAQANDCQLLHIVNHDDDASIFKKNIMEEIIPNLAEMVERDFNSRIELALRNKDLRLVIIDTILASHPRGAYSTLTPKLKNYFKLHYHVDSFICLENSNGSDKTNQLSLSGPFSLLRMGTKDGMKSPKDYQHETADFTLQGHTVFRGGAVFSDVRVPSGAVIGRIESINVVAELISRLEEPEIEDVPGYGLTESELVDPELAHAHLNLQEYVQMLVDEGSDIKSHFEILGFRVAFPLQNSVGQGMEDANLSYLKNLTHLSEMLYENAVTDRAFTEQELVDEDMSEGLSKSLVLIAYREIFGNSGARFWKNKWARQARGTALAINPTTKVVSVLSYKLPRGTEVLTNSHVKSGIVKTEDMDSIDKVNSIFDKEQLAAIEALARDGAIETYATSKGDGAMCVWTIYTGSSAKFMGSVIDCFGSDLSKLIKAQSLFISNGEKVAVLSTQGTIFESNKSTTTSIWEYMVSACLAGTSLVLFDDLKVYSESHSHVQAWEKWGSSFIKELLGNTFILRHSDSASFIFEAILPKRTDPFTKREHVEFAVSYDDANLLFLGASICSKLVFIPHMLLRSIYKSRGENMTPIFREPIWWHIKDNDGDATISNLLSAFSSVIREEMTQADLFRSFPPSNCDFDVSKVDSFPLDVEGFVMMTPRVVTVPDHPDLFFELGIRDTDYSKAKTQEYYKTHKPKSRLIPYYMELNAIPTARSRFPIVARVSDFFGPNRIHGSLLKISSRAVALLDGTATFQVEGEDGESIERSYREKYLQQLNEGQRAGFDRNPEFSTQCSMLVNICTEQFSQDLLPIFEEAFPSIKGREYPHDFFPKGIVMDLRPWEFLHVETFRRNLPKLSETYDLDVDVKPDDSPETKLKKQIAAFTFERLSCPNYNSSAMKSLASVVLGFNRKWID